MTIVRTVIQAKEELLEVLRGRDAALVIGAGASVSSSGPTAEQLVTEWRTRFSQAPLADKSSLLDVGTAICNTPPYGRLELVKLLRGRLEALQPHAAYQQLPQHRWRALFTTNYDDLIEKAYSTPSREQTLQPVNVPYERFTVPRENHLHLFYLQGSIKEPPESAASPVVCWSDFISAVQKRVSALQILQNVLLDGGRVIYVGYSFNDFILDGLLDEAAQRIGPSNVPYGYAILAGWPADPRHAMHRVSRQNIIPIEGTFEEFAELVCAAAEAYRTDPSAPPKQAPAMGKSLTVRSARVNLPEGDVSVASEAFEIIGDNDLQATALSDEERSALTRAFLRGEFLGWTPFANSWAFVGSAYEKVFGMVENELKRAADGDSGIVLIHGAAGLGKSVMARQLVFDVSAKLQFPALFAKSTWMARPDIKLLDRFCDDLEQQLPEDAAFPPLVIVIDRAELLDRSVPQRVLSYLKSQGRRVVVVLFARTNEYFRVARVPDETPDHWGHPKEIQLEDKLSRGDITKLVHHIASLGVWKPNRITDERFWISYVEKELSSRFFDAVYSLVEQTQEPLAERVWSEFSNLSGTAQRAYLLIASVYQFGISLKMEILMRALALPFAEFERVVVKSDARDVLFSEHQTSELNIFFRGRSRIISELVVARALPDRGEQLLQFKAIVEATNPNEMFGLDELDALRTLLVQVLGPSGYDRRFLPDQVAALFELATARIEDDVLEHHFGLLERAAGRLISARLHLEKALALSATLPYDLATLRESPQNIENSLAQVLGDLALEALRRSDRTGAATLFEEARERFLAARSGTFPNAAAYDAHARMLLKRATRLFALGDPDRSIGLSDALDVVADGLANVNPEYRVGLVELQTTILEELGLDEDARKNLVRLASEGDHKNRARYELLLARLITRGDLADLKVKRLKVALAHCSSACDLDPTYGAAWVLRAELYKALHPTDYAGLAELLESASVHNARNMWVFFELGVAYFHLDQYERSNDAFRRLRMLSRGHSLGSGVVELAGTRGGDEPFLFEGRIIRRKSGSGLAVQSVDLESFQEVFFNPRGQRFYTPRLGDRVSFVVGFNYKGLIADELRRL